MDLLPLNQLLYIQLLLQNQPIIPGQRTDRAVAEPEGEVAGGQQGGGDGQPEDVEFEEVK